MKLRPFELCLSLLIAAPFLGCATTARQERERTFADHQKAAEAAKVAPDGAAIPAPPAPDDKPVDAPK